MITFKEWTFLTVKTSNTAEFGPVVREIQWAVTASDGTKEKVISSAINFSVTAVIDGVEDPLTHQRPRFIYFDDIQDADLIEWVKQYYLAPENRFGFEKIAELELELEAMNDALGD